MLCHAMVIHWQGTVTLDFVILPADCKAWFLQRATCHIAALGGLGMACTSARYDHKVYIYGTGWGFYFCTGYLVNTPNINTACSFRCTFKFVFHAPTNQSFKSSLGICQRFHFFPYHRFGPDITDVMWKHIEVYCIFIGICCFTKDVILHVVEAIYMSLKNRKLLIVCWKFLPIQSSLTKRTLSSTSCLHIMLWGPCINAIQCVIWQVCLLYIYCLVCDTPVFLF